MWNAYISNTNSYTYVFGVKSLSDVWVCCASKMAAINRKLIWHNAYLNLCIRYQRIKFPMAIPCFLGRATRLDYCGDSPMCRWARIRRWRPSIGSRYDVTHISACIYVGNTISAAKLMLSGSGNKTKLMRRLLDKGIHEESKMNCRLTDALFLIHNWSTRRAVFAVL